MPGATAERLARAAKAVDLKLAGASYRAIGERLGVSHGQVERDVALVLDRMLAEPVARMRALHLARLERLLLAAWPRATAGDLDAIDTCRRLLDSVAKLLGLDEPAKVDVRHWVRMLAEQEGLDPEQAVKDAETILKATGR